MRTVMTWVKALTDRQRRRRTFGLAAVASLLCLVTLATALAHKPRPVPARFSQRCPLVDGRGGNFDTARTDALMKTSRCWLNI